MKHEKKLPDQSAPAGPYSPWSPNRKPPEHPDRYVIEVLGCIGNDWSNWFGGFAVECNEKTGVTSITGNMKDQAELFSILLKVQSLGLTLIRINSNSKP